MARFSGFSPFALAFAATQACAQVTTTGAGGTTPPSPFVVHGTTSVDVAHQIPCDRVHLNADGSYTILGTVVYDDQVTFADTTLGREDALILKARCGHARFSFFAGSLPALPSRQTSR